MEFLSLAEQFEIEKETVRTLLNSVLAEHGAEKEFARRTGLSTVHLSYLRKGKRLASVATAKQIAAALPWTTEQRERFVHHAAQVWRLKNSLWRNTQRNTPGKPNQEVVDIVRHAQNDATFARDAAAAQRLYRRAANMAELLLTQTDPNQDPLNFVELSFVAHDALCVLNRSDEALWHAKRVRLVTQQLNRKDFRDPERVDFMQVNALRCEAVALHNLHLARPMQEVCAQVETLEGLKRGEQFWRPWLNRDKIQALMDLPRFSIREVEMLARQVFRLCDSRGDAYDPLMVLLISQSLTRAYMQYENFDKAYQVLNQAHADVDTIPHVGPLHRVLFFKTFAQWYWLQGSHGDEWCYFADKAFALATEAGLEHQLNELRQEFGTLHSRE
mgnify:CR=1 FL=1